MNLFKKIMNSITSFIGILFISILIGTLVFLVANFFSQTIEKLYNKKHSIYYKKVPAAINNLSLIKEDSYPYDEELKGVFYEKKLHITYIYYLNGKRYENDSIGFTKRKNIDYSESISSFDIELYKKLKDQMNIFVWVNPYYPNKSSIYFDQYYHYAILIFWFLVGIFFSLIGINLILKRSI